MKLINHMLDTLFPAADLTPHSRNLAMKRLLAIPVGEPQREVPEGEMEVSCGR